MPPALPPITRAIIVLNVLVFLLQQVAGPVMENLFALWPLADSRFQPWQLLTYAFLHEGSLARLQFSHIFINMFGLFLCGSPLESLWGRLRYTLYYLVCILSAAIIELWIENATHSPGIMLGASGGVFGLLLAFGWYLPKEQMGILLLPIPIPAWLFAAIFGGVELYLALAGNQSDVAHLAHLGGMLGGALAILYWRIQSRIVG
jgi:membrane associated rhomboid family serine protease